MKRINKKELHEIFQELKDESKSQIAYNKLYEQYYSLIYGIVFSIIKNKVDSEDVTHEIFTKIYKLDSSKLPQNNEASWLFSVSKNECLLFFRKAKPNVSIDEIYEIPAVSNEIDNVVDREYYNQLMCGLKDDEKMIVSLKLLSNFTFNKISQVMGIPIGTVQWKYYNAINSLKISIGSLVGAVLAFIMVIARGEFWRNKEYVNNSEKTNIYNESIDKVSEGSDSSNTEKQKMDSTQSKESENEIKDKSDVNQINISPKNNVDEVTETLEITPNSTNIMKNIDTLQIVFLTVGIIFLVIFTIFFKIYQQKLKKKASK